MTAIYHDAPCGLCGSTKNLLRCSRCKVTFYCCANHQAVHYPTHKSACSLIARRTKQLEGEEKILRGVPQCPNTLFPPHVDIFKDYAGMFWGILETREYMRARYALVNALQAVDNRYSVQTQLDHLMDMLRLCRGDNMGVRSVVPGLLMRLNRDQECYDFVKWWSTIRSDYDYDYGDMKQPYLNIRNANAFEDVEFISKALPDLSHTAAMVLIKIKMISDLEQMEKCAIIGSKVPPEILWRIQFHAAESPIIASNSKLLGRLNYDDEISLLSDHLDHLYLSVDIYNRFFWRRLLTPGNSLTAKPTCYSMGSLEEAQIALQYTYKSWAETPKAFKQLGNRLIANGHDLSLAPDEQEENDDAEFDCACPHCRDRDADF